MKTLVLYDSRFGNTEQIARTIAQSLATYGEATALRITSTQPVELSGVDLLIVGSPTQGFQPTQAMEAYLATLTPASVQHAKVACFDTRFHGRLMSHSAAPAIARTFQRLGVTLLVPPESFYVRAWQQAGPLVEGERARAASWALQVYMRYAPVPASVR